jgi:hypothetical protein
LNGEEWWSWDLQLQRIGRAPSIKGRHVIRIEAGRRTIVATVYVSLELDTIYVLGYHIDRKGEPTENQQARVDEYCLEIEKLERHREV